MKLNIYKLDKKTDERGWLMEILKSNHVNGNFGQIFVTVAKPGISKGGHYHTRKKEWFCVIKGEGILYLEDLDTKEKKEIEMGENNLITIEIPINTLHTIKNTSETKDLYLLSYVNEVFNPEDPDTFRVENE